MDPISLIIAALAAGATAGVKDTASAAVNDAYEGLKGLIRHRFGRDSAALADLQKVETAPDSDHAALSERLRSAGAGNDEQLIRLAQDVLKHTDPAGARIGKYNVVITGGKGIAIGDHQTVTMNFTD